MTTSDTISPAYLTANNRAWLDGLTDAEKIVLFHSRHFWAREGQLPFDDNWLFHGWVAGRGAGKSWASAQLVQSLVDSGKARRIAMSAQDEVMTYKVCVEMLKEIAPPWNFPEVRLNSLHWPNGAVADIFSPETPEKVRGPSYDLAWATELSFWNNAVAAFNNLTTATRPGGRVVWDSTSKGSSPLIQFMLKMNRLDPYKYRVVRGSMLDNPAYGKDYIQRETIKYGGPGSRRYEEEVNGAVFDHDEGAAFSQSALDDSRVYETPNLELKLVGLDTAITTHRAADATGIVYAGRDARGHVYALRDATGRHEPERTGKMLVDAHFEGYAGCVVETNRGGNFIAANIRAVAKERGVEVRILGTSDKFPRYTRGVFYVREVTARGKKLERAEPVATLIKLGKGHIVGKMSELETQLTTYDGSGESPNSLDAFVMVMSELGNLFVDTPLVSHRQRRSEQEAEANRQLVTALSAKARAKSVL